MRRVEERVGAVVVDGGSGRCGTVEGVNVVVEDGGNYRSGIVDGVDAVVVYEGSDRSGIRYCGGSRCGSGGWRQW